MMMDMIITDWDDYGDSTVDDFDDTGSHEKSNNGGGSICNGVSCANGLI